MLTCPDFRNVSDERYAVRVAADEHPGKVVHGQLKRYPFKKVK